MTRLTSVLAICIILSTTLAAQERGSKPMKEVKIDLTIRFKLGAEQFEMPFQRIPGGTFTMGTPKAVFALLQ